MFFEKREQLDKGTHQELSVLALAEMDFNFVHRSFALKGVLALPNRFKKLEREVSMALDHPVERTDRRLTIHAEKVSRD
jgi:hypothetical protein